MGYGYTYLEEDITQEPTGARTVPGDQISALEVQD